MSDSTSAAAPDSAAEQTSLPEPTPEEVKSAGDLQEACNVLRQRLMETLSEELFQHAVERIGTVERGQKDNYLDLYFAHDFAIFECRTTGKSVLEQLLEQITPSLDAKQTAAAQALRNTRFSLFVIKKVVGENEVRLLDLLRSEELRVMRKEIKEAQEGEFVLTRLVPCGNVWISQIMLPVSPTTMSYAARSLTPLLGKPFWKKMQRLTPEKHANMVALILRWVIGALPPVPLAAETASSSESTVPA